MRLPCQEYELQIEKARQTLAELEEKIQQVKNKLDKKPEDAVYRRELKQLSLDLKITLNELEHSQSELENCHSRKKGNEPQKV